MFAVYADIFFQITCAVALMAAAITNVRVSQNYRKLIKSNIELHEVYKTTLSAMLDLNTVYQNTHAAFTYMKKAYEYTPDPTRPPN